MMKKYITSEDLNTPLKIFEDINIIVGFNGSGKTKLLNKILSSNKDTALMYNRLNGLPPSFIDFPEVLKELNNYFEVLNKLLVIKNNELLCEIQGKEYPYTVLSENERYLIDLLFWIYTSSQDYVTLLIDNIETGLHLQFQEELLRSLLKLAPETQFFVTTHSPGIVMDGYLDSFLNIENFKSFLDS